MVHKKSVVKNSAKVQYNLQRRKNRKRITVRVKDDGTIVVSAPLITPLSVIEDVVANNFDWIVAKRAQVAQLPLSLPPHTYTTGDRFLVLGEEHRLEVEHGKVNATMCSLQGTTLIVKTRKGAKEVAIRRAIERWYTNFGEELYREFVAQWIGEIEEIPYIQFSAVEIASYPKRWGSCSQKGKLCFALRSLMLPLSLIEYLALHEVAHLYYFNHGPEFKSILDTYMPDWRERQRRMNTLRRQVAAL